MNSACCSCPLAGVGKTLDQFRRVGAERLKAVLDGPIANGHRQMRLPAPVLPVQDQRAPLPDEIRLEIGTEMRLPQNRLSVEVELLDGSEEGEVRLAREARRPRLLAVRHLFRQQKSQKVAIGPLLLLRTIGNLRIDVARAGQVQTTEQSFDLTGGEFRDLRLMARTRFFPGTAGEAPSKKLLCRLPSAKFFVPSRDSSLSPDSFTAVLAVKVSLRRGSAAPLTAAGRWESPPQGREG